MRARRNSDEDIEKLLAGRTPEDEEYARLTPLTQALMRAGRRIPPETETAQVAAQAAALSRTAMEGAPSGAARPHELRSGHLHRLTPRLAGLLAVIVVFSSTAGVAFAANAAAPGDTLYGFDLALERIGLGAGGLHERLAEASELADRGAIERGIAHATEALAEAGVNDGIADEARGALVVAANAVSTANVGDIESVRQRVAQMLRWMATADAHDADFGRYATELARGVAGDHGAGPDAVGPDGASATSTTNPNANNNGPNALPNGNPSSTSATTPGGQPSNGSSGPPSSSGHSGPIDGGESPTTTNTNGGSQNTGGLGGSSGVTPLGPSGTNPGYQSPDAQNGQGGTRP